MNGLRRILVILISLPLLFSSCSADDLQSLYENGDYESLLESCSGSLEEDNLYYTMMAQYRLGEEEKSQETALVYSLMYGGKNERRSANALRIMLIYSPETRIRIDAGSTLVSSSQCTVSDEMYYFLALMEREEYEMASDVYNSLRGRISSRNAALLCINAGASGTLIVQNLEGWLSEEGTGQEFEEALASASRLLLDRGEGQLILPLVLEANRNPSSRWALILGDIYAQNGDRTSARTYYSQAYSAYPEVVTSRLVRLSSPST